MKLYPYVQIIFKYPWSPPYLQIFLQQSITKYLLNTLVEVAWEDILTTLEPEL